MTGHVEAQRPSDSTAKRAAALSSSALTLRRGLRFRAVVPAFEVGPGLSLVLGRNGAGKSTLLEVLAGRRKPLQGTIRVNGRVHAGTRGRAVLRRTVGYLPQEAGLPRGWTVAEYLSYAAWLRGVPRTSALREALAIAETLELHAPERRTLGSLSGGMRRRVLIGQALVAGPTVVVLDEPDAGLDREAASGLARLLSQAQLQAARTDDTADSHSVLRGGGSYGVPIVAAVHRVDEFAAMAAQVLDLSAAAGATR